MNRPRLLPYYPAQLLPLGCTLGRIEARRFGWPAHYAMQRIANNPVQSVVQNGMAVEVTLADGLVIDYAYDQVAYVANASIHHVI